LPDLFHQCLYEQFLSQLVSRKLEGDVMSLSAVCGSSVSVVLVSVIVY